MNKPLVSVVMITYNHEKYIEQAIKGILMQKCNFEVELIIADDCSTDKTETIINKINDSEPNTSWIKYTRHKKNIGMIPNFVFALEQSKGKYIALCEGDDYWTDPQKLQKQVEFLETNSSANACFHDVHFVDGSNLIIREIYFDARQPVYTQYDCLTTLSSAYATCSLLFKRDALFPLPNWSSTTLCDMTLDLLITENGTLNHIPLNLGAYRFHPGGIWSGNDKKGNVIEVLRRYIVLYSDDNFKSKYSKELSSIITKYIRHLFVLNTLNSSERIKFAKLYIQHCDDKLRTKIAFLAPRLIR